MPETGHSGRARGARLLLRWALVLRSGIALGVPLIYFAIAALSSVTQQSERAFASRHLLSTSSRLAAEDGTTFAPFNCTPPAILDFPADLFTDVERRHGAALLHAFLAFYLFILLAIVCDDYFVPSIERLIEVLGVTDDVGGATLMAAATSSPELFINVVGTFVTEGDIGVGAILGSAVFNILAVPACCGIAASKEIMLDWWPMTRDCGVYVLAVVALIVCLADEVVHWYEAAILVSMYVGYIVLMVYNRRISQWASRKVLIKCWSAPPELTPLLPPQANQSEVHVQVVRGEQEDSLLAWLHSFNPSETKYESVSTRQLNENINDEERDAEADAKAVQRGWCASGWWVFTAPIRLVLFLSIPNQKCCPRLYPLTFIMCICWIGSMTYVISWMITVVGDTLRIPDSVMGITFLAAGTSVPEVVSSVIVTRSGHGGMGISNSLGSNIFDILLCLGLPWLIKSTMLATAVPLVGPARSRQELERAVVINSDGLEYSAVSLLSSTLLLFATFSCYHFRLNRRVGAACFALYALYLLLASLIELNVFFTVNLPVCGR
ncbi:Hypothetical predicted protein [Cloeon dipterum]|uniref:Sodium/calcium exchanger membrane region domain-containing protein n=1 Tax=Cloeon dipterum TaxID=197152 RepID=A0A8S1C374_9INSE|nr:Hypothetical predicted protein [Cloeon dipterum]